MTEYWCLSTAPSAMAYWMQARISSGALMERQPNSRMCCVCGLESSRPPPVRSTPMTRGGASPASLCLQRQRSTGQACSNPSTRAIRPLRLVCLIRAQRGKHLTPASPPAGWVRISSCWAAFRYIRGSHTALDRLDDLFGPLRRHIITSPLDDLQARVGDPGGQFRLMFGRKLKVVTPRHDQRVGALISPSRSPEPEHWCWSGHDWLQPWSVLSATPPAITA